MFLAEAEIAARIQHPNVCAILDAGEDDGILYLVMEWIDGDPLSVLQRRCREQDNDNQGKGTLDAHEMEIRLVIIAPADGAAEGWLARGAKKAGNLIARQWPLWYLK